MENASLKIKGIHKETSESVHIVHTVLSPFSGVRGADFSQPSTIGFSKPGLWRMEVYVDDKRFGSIVVNVKKKTSS
ncbi:hypothetical protein SAMN05444955_11455 [Lihuaxuella thermophila]|uniref:YtkA-like n=1 Tax=Lihuaxuella thermophila TaxID=1173111 RepID=A0A1H8HJ18_9BACL|nr:hypothetical protein SAMN05444955_11455 [Lihuaxuella thermophila]